MPNLFIDIEGRFAKFQDSLDRVGRTSQSTFGRINNSINALNRTIGILGVGFGVSKIIQGFFDLVNAADELNKLSQKVGVGVQALSEFSFAAKLADVSNEELSIGLRKLSQNIVEGDDAFRRIEVSVTNTDGSLRATEDILRDVATRFAAMRDGAEKTALAVALFGRSGSELIPFLNQGGEGLRRMAEEARKLGVVLTKETAQAAEDFNDNLLRLGQAIEGVNRGLTGGLIKFLADAAEEAVNATKAFGGFYKGLLGALTLNPFKSAIESAQGFRAEISELEASLAKLQAGGAAAVGTLLTDGTEQFVQRKLDLAKQRLEFVESIIERDVKKSDAALRKTAPDFGRADTKEFKPLAAKTKDAGGREDRDRERTQKQLREETFRQIQNISEGQLEFDRVLSERSLAIKRQELDDKKISLSRFAQETIRINQEIADQEIRALDAKKSALQEDLSRPELSRPENQAEQLRISGDILSIENQKRIVVERTRQAQEDVSRDALRSAEELFRAENDISAEIRSRRGIFDITFERGKIEKEFEELRKELFENKQFASVLQVDLLVNTKVAEVQLQRFESQFSTIQERFQNEEIRIDIRQETGKIGTADAEKELLALRRAQLAELAPLSAALEQFAADNEGVVSPETLANLDRMRLSMEELRAATDESGKQWAEFRRNAEDAMQGVGSAILDALKTGENAIGEFFERLANRLAGQAIDKVLQGVLDKALAALQQSSFGSNLFGGAAAASGAGAQGVFGTLLGGVGASTTQGAAGTAVASSDIFGGAGAAGAAGAAGVAGAAGADASLTALATTAAGADASLLTLGTSATSADAGLLEVVTSATGTNTGLSTLIGPLTSASGAVTSFAAAVIQAIATMQASSAASAAGSVAIAKGGIFSAGYLMPFARGGVVSAPVFFPMADGGTGLMGEAGPEAVMPLKDGGIRAVQADGTVQSMTLMRDRQGNLAVRAFAKGGIVGDEKLVTAWGAPLVMMEDGGIVSLPQITRMSQIAVSESVERLAAVSEASMSAQSERLAETKTKAIANEISRQSRVTRSDTSRASSVSREATDTEIASSFREFARENYLSEYEVARHATSKQASESMARDSQSITATFHDALASISESDSVSKTKEIFEAAERISSLSDSSRKHIAEGARVSSSPPSADVEMRLAASAISEKLVSRFDRLTTDTGDYRSASSDSIERYVSDYRRAEYDSRDIPQLWRISLLGSTGTDLFVSLPEKQQRLLSVFSPSFSSLNQSETATTEAHAELAGSILNVAKYASGGIVSSPQLFAAGEGSMNEAVIPLPNGKSVPVELKGGDSGGMSVVMNIKTPDVAGFRRSQTQVLNDLTNAMGNAQRRR